MPERENPSLPAPLEDALGELLWREGGDSEMAFEDLVRANPEFEDLLRSRREFLLDEVDETLGAPERDHSHDLTGKILGGKYRVLRLRGEGGFGSVYEAVDEMLGASVAVKVLHMSASEHPDVLDRFLGEARVLTNLDHPNVVRWITFDKTDDDLHYFVMEFLVGEELSEILKRERQLEPERAIDILSQVVSALRAAHELPDGTTLLHLDLKPQNVFVLKGHPERVKVIDFGISQHVGAEARAAAGIQMMPDNWDKAGFDLSQTITASVEPAFVLDTDGKEIQRARGGTLLYASPEQSKHLAGMSDLVELDVRSDIYSLGVMAFQLLAGELPYKHGATPMEALEAHLYQPVRRFASLGVKVPRKLEAWVMRCLEKDRDQRFQDIEEAHEALDRIANPRSRWPLYAGVAAVVAALVLWILWPDPPLPPFDVRTQGTVWMGPEAGVRRLAVANLELDDPRATVQLVSDVKDTEAALPGWTARLIENGRIEIVAPSDARTAARDLYVKVTQGDRDQLSQSVRLAFIGTDAWGIESAAVPGLEVDLLDPLGAELHVVLAGAPDPIEGVAVTLAGETREATLDRSLSATDRSVYTLPFAAFGQALPTGKCELVVEARDRAGMLRTEELAFELDPAPLEVTARLAGPGCFQSAPGEFLVGPESEPVLVTDSNRALELGVSALGSDGSTLSVRSEETANGLRLHFPSSETPYFGQLKVEAVDRGAYHPDPARRRVEKTLRFRYETQAVVVHASVVGTVEWTPPESEESVAFTRAARATLSLARRNDVWATVERTCHAPDGTEEKRDHRLHETASLGDELSLAQDGLYRIDLEAYRHLSANAERPEQHEFRDELLLVRDSSPPRMTATLREDPTAAFVLADVELVDDALGLAAAPPLELAWRLERPASAAKTGRLEVSGTGSVELGWEDLDLDPRSLADGAYSLHLVARDLAGNTSPESPPLTWDVAREGPALDFPSLGATWQPMSANSFRVVVQARDANGVDRVVCRAVAGGRALEASLSSSGSGEWSGTLALPGNWSERDIELECEAFDRFGMSNVERRGIRLGTFEAPRPEVFVPRLEAPVARMRLLRGDDYTFGGRNARRERELFREYGLEVDFRPLEEDVLVEDFYLDETEVSVREFAAFVAAGDGYMNPVHWSSTGPRDTRRAELETWLAGRDPDLPVTGVDAHEAAAYAHWVGKRLPAAVEWEYAVRGGIAYRAFAWDGEHAAVERALGGSADPRRVGGGPDVTPEGIFDLCSNVAEWTSTPQGERVYAAGADYERSEHHFRILTPRYADSRLATVGFRCALDAKEVDKFIEKEIAIESPGTRASK